MNANDTSGGAGPGVISNRPEWVKDDFSRVPYWIYTDEALFTDEMQRIFCGKSWSYVGLGAEVPNPGSFLTTYVGNRSIIVCRNREGELRAFANRCAHRGVKFCRHHLGQTSRFTCPYHQWTYDLDGALKGVNFGGGARYIEKSVIGNPVILNSTGAVTGLDLAHPYYLGGYVALDAWVGYKLKVFHDKYDLSFQLNIRDLEQNGHFRPIVANSDGAHSVYRIVQPRTFYLTTTLGF